MESVRKEELTKNDIEIADCENKKLSEKKFLSDQKLKNEELKNLVERLTKENSELKQNYGRIEVKNEQLHTEDEIPTFEHESTYLDDEIKKEIIIEPLEFGHHCQPDQNRWLTANNGNIANATNVSLISVKREEELTKNDVENVDCENKKPEKKFFSDQASAQKPIRFLSPPASPSPQNDEQSRSDSKLKESVESDSENSDGDSISRKNSTKNSINNIDSEIITKEPSNESAESVSKIFARKIMCTICGKSHFNKSNAKKHYKKCSKCLFCGKMNFKNKIAKNLHVKNIHKMSKKQYNEKFPQDLTFANDEMDKNPSTKINRIKSSHTRSVPVHVNVWGNPWGWVTPEGAPKSSKAKNCNFCKKGKSLLHYEAKHLRLSNNIPVKPLPQLF